MDLSQPLTDAEFDELDKFLISEGTPEECMDISMLITLRKRGQIALTAVGVVKHIAE